MPGPTSYKPSFSLVERKGSQGYSFGKPSKTQVKPQKDERVILYPSIDAARPNFRPSKTVMKQPQASPVRIKSSVSEAETRLSSDEKPKKPAKAPRIAPEKYSKLTSVELDRLLWHQLLLNP